MKNRKEVGLIKKDNKVYILSMEDFLVILAIGKETFNSYFELVPKEEKSQLKDCDVIGSIEF